jgi:type VI secretion system FHA domain protein
VTLILEVTSPQPVGSASRQTFHAEGGTIGRDRDNSWVLPHSKVSGLHAVISCRDAVYYIEDRSRNGVYLNSSTNRLERNRPSELKSGDRILIEPYEIRVSIVRDRDDRAERDFGEFPGVSSSSARAAAANPFDDNDPFASGPSHSSTLEAPEEQMPSQALDPLELLNLVPKRAPARKPRTGNDLQLGSPLDGHYRPPAVVPAAAAPPPPSMSTIPEDYDPLAPDDADAVPVSRAPDPPRPEPPAYRPREPRVAPTPMAPAPLPLPAEKPPVVQAAPPAPPVRERAADASNSDPAGVVDFAAVLSGAGLDPAEVSPEVAREFGQILRVVVSGVMDVMRSRQQIKDEFRMQVTRVRAIENNPLKFSANVDDALHNLLMKRNPAYLPPVEAFSDAFADLRHHQIAMLAGMRVAFESMLAEFDPDQMQQDFDRQLSKGLVPAKLRYWDLFREKRHEIVKDPEASFRRLFGETFARAYEEQLATLKAQERRSAKGPSTARTGVDEPGDSL